MRDSAIFRHRSGWGSPLCRRIRSMRQARPRAIPRPSLTILQCPAASHFSIPAKTGFGVDAMPEWRALALRTDAALVVELGAVS